MNSFNIVHISEDNPSISEPGLMYKNGSDSDRSKTIRPGIEMPDVVSICTKNGSDNDDPGYFPYQKKSLDPYPNRMWIHHVYWVTFECSAAGQSISVS